MEPRSREGVCTFPRLEGSEVMSESFDHRVEPLLTAYSTGNARASLAQSIRLERRSLNLNQQILPQNRIFSRIPCFTVLKAKHSFVYKQRQLACSGICWLQVSNQSVCVSEKTLMGTDSVNMISRGQRIESGTAADANWIRYPLYFI